MLCQFPFFALAPTEVPGREVSIVAISETVLVLAGGTAVLSILFGVRVAMRAVAGSAAAPRSDGGQAAGGSGTPDVAGVIALPPLIVLGFLAAAVLEAIVPLPVPVAHSLARYVAGATLAAGGFVIIAIGTRRFAAAGTNVPPTLPTTALRRDPSGMLKRESEELGLSPHLRSLVQLHLPTKAESVTANPLTV